MGQTWFTGDLHFDSGLFRSRGYTTTREHDEAIESAWRALIGPDDVVWVLGNVTPQPWTPRSDGRMNAWERFARLPGRKRLIVGDIDPAHPAHPRAMHALANEQAIQACEFVGVTGSVEVAGRTVLLSHYPYDPQGTWRAPDRGWPLIHAHVDTTARTSTSALGSPQVNVGLRAWGLHPVHLDEVVDLLATF